MPKFYLMQTILILLLSFLLSFENQCKVVGIQRKVLKWEGAYRLGFSHKRKCAPPMIWEYKIRIRSDDCRIQISGFQIDKDYSCYYKEAKDTLYIYGKEDIKYHVDSIRNEIVFKIYKSGLYYYTTKEYKFEEADEKPTKYGYKLIKNR